MSRQGMVIQQIITPAYPTVDKSRNDLYVECSKFGFATASQINTSGVEGWVFGNIVFGGIIGLVIDLSTGAVHRYDSAMNFKLPPNSAVALAAAQAGMPLYQPTFGTRSDPLSKPVYPLSNPAY